MLVVNLENASRFTRRLDLPHRQRLCIPVHVFLEHDPRSLGAVANLRNVLSRESCSQRLCRRPSLHGSDSAVRHPPNILWFMIRPNVNEHAQPRHVRRVPALEVEVVRDPVQQVAGEGEVEAGGGVAGGG